MKTPMKSPFGKMAVRLSPMTKFNSSRMRPGNKRVGPNIILLIIPFSIIALLFYMRPNLDGAVIEDSSLFLNMDASTDRIVGGASNGANNNDPLAIKKSANSINNNQNTLSMQQQIQEQQLVQNQSTDEDDDIDSVDDYEDLFDVPIPDDVDDALAELEQCEDFQCLKRAHYAIHGRTKFNFPHYFLVGWQKCGTTSVNANLRLHPEYLPSSVKESHYFTTCQHWFQHPQCMAQNESHYIREFFRLEDAVASRLERVSVDASVDYAWKGTAIAPELKKLFPWIKIVFIIREPISRLISYVRMYTQRKHAIKGCLDGRSMYDCLQYHLNPSEANSNYSTPLAAWFEHFPADQLHIIQFEQLQEEPNEVMRNLKLFLGMDPDLPKKLLWNTNLRKSGGYSVTLDEYKMLLDQVKWDSDKVAGMLSARGLADKRQWLARWEKVWDENLATCDENGMCMINSN